MKTSIQPTWEKIKNFFFVVENDSDGVCSARDMFPPAFTYSAINTIHMTYETF